VGTKKGGKGRDGGERREPEGKVKWEREKVGKK